MDPCKEEDTKMYFYENRLRTFEGWPFEEGCSCTPENMAKAGFIHTPSENSPDVAMCFFCLKELEGWEPQDDPEKEHKSHSSSCHFIALKKKIEELSVEEFFKLQKERQKFMINKSCNEAITKFEEAAKLTRADIVKTAFGILTLCGGSLYVIYSYQALAETERLVGPEGLANIRTSFGWSLGLSWLSYSMELITGMLLLVAAE